MLDSNNKAAVFVCPFSSQQLLPSLGLLADFFVISI